MGCDLDMDNEELCYELDKWGTWYIEETGIDGVRLDAIKHLKFTFFNEWLPFVRKNNKKRDTCYRRILVWGFKCFNKLS